MMDILGLTSTEAKQLLLINKKIEHSNKKQAAYVLKLTKERGYFQSKAGKVYIKTIENIVNDFAPIDCIYCRNMLDGDNSVICNHCISKLEDKVRNDELQELLDEKSNKSKHVEGDSEKKGQNNISKTINKKIVFCGILVFLIVLSLALFLIIRNRADTDAESYAETVSSAEDGLWLLGEMYSEADRRFGTYENVVSENTRYYPSSGISILYNASTGVVIYLDNDGTGTGEISAPIFGILPGDNVTQVKSHLAEVGINAIDVSGDTFVCQFSPSEFEDFVYEIDVVYSDNVVELVSAKLKNN